MPNRLFPAVFLEVTYEIQAHLPSSVLIMCHQSNDKQQCYGGDGKIKLFSPNSKTNLLSQL